MTGTSGQGELCGYRWPLLATGDHDTDAQLVLDGMASHLCGRALGHFGPHRCSHDGEQVER